MDTNNTNSICVCLLNGSDIANLTDLLETHFGRAGPIENVHIINECVLLIKFKYPEASRRVLSDKMFLNFFGQNLNILPASMFQNLYKKDNTIFGLRLLNSDCIVHLMNFLDITDAVNLAESDEYVKKVSPDHFRKYQHFVVNEKCRKMNVKLIRCIFKHIGVYIKSLEIHYSSIGRLTTQEIIYDIIIEHCPNVEILKLFGMISLPEPTEDSKRFFRNIQTLKFSECSFRDDEIMQLFNKNSTSLHHLELIRCRNLTGFCCTHFVTLNTLHLVACYNLQNINMKRTFELNQNLTDMMLLLTVPPIFDNLRCLQNLKVLQFYTIANFDTMELEVLSNLNSLRHLTIKFVENQEINHLLTKLGEKDILDELILCRIIINAASIEALSLFRKIRNLYLCSDQNDEMEKKLRKLLPSQINLKMSGCNFCK